MKKRTEQKVISEVLINERLIKSSKMSKENLLKEMKNTLNGYSKEEVERRIRKYGKNVISHEKGDSVLKRLIESFVNPFTVVLFILAIISAFTDIILQAPKDRSYSTVVIIITMVTISGILKFVQESKSNNSAEKLKDMIGVERPIVYKKGERNAYAEKFSYAVTHSIKSALCDAGGYELKTKKNTVISRAAEWFLSHYPLLGGLAAAFKIVEDIEMCHRYEIHIAAVDAEQGIIYANPSCGFSEEEWIFVLAHEYLHAGLQHQKRCNGRDFFLWNIACDYVINDWLHEMEIGRMPPDGLLYDETLHNKSAESIYDLIVKEIRKYKKLNTFRGFGRGDMFNGNRPHFTGRENGVSLDELLKNALWEGLDYHQEHNRGFLPAGLVQEIRALAMPVIPWDAALAKWFDVQFPPLEKHRTYARPSRRQGATPDIPRPGYAYYEQDLESRTFGVVVDTSGSMSAKQIGMALGSIASYAAAKDVPFVRIIFCDAKATDAGYLAPEDIAGRVKVTGRGGTILQPGVDCLEQANDFPKDGPILIITDGEIENDLKVRREHAFLLPRGNRLPFRARGEVFYFRE